MYFPLMVNLQNKKICIIGGGEVAKKRGLELKNHCKDITVIARFFQNLVIQSFHIAFSLSLHSFSVRTARLA